MVDTKRQGAFEELASKIEELLPAEGDWWISEEQNELVIQTAVSRDPSRNRNGGEYDFHTSFKPVGDGVRVYQWSSCELPIDTMGIDSYTAVTIPVIVGLDGLRRIAALVGLRAACKQFLARKLGFADLKAAIELAA